MVNAFCVVPVRIPLSLNHGYLPIRDVGGVHVCARACQQIELERFLRVILANEVHLQGGVPQL